MQVNTIQAVLSDGARRLLLTSLEMADGIKNYGTLIAHHVTIAYRATSEQIENIINTDGSITLEDGLDVTIRVSKHVFDDDYGVEAVTAKVLTSTGAEVQSLNPNPHITISIAPHRKPVDSNTLLDTMSDRLGDFVDVGLKLDAKIKFLYFK